MCEHPSIMYRKRGINPATGRFYPPVSPSIAAQFMYVGYDECIVPCGRCFSCLKNKARDIAVRAYHESLCHRENMFLTLTVSDEHMDDVFPGRSLQHRPFQLFMKRLRKRLHSDGDLRYLMCGEYGERSLRPHYHSVVFGLGPDRRRKLAIIKTSDDLLFGDRTLYTGFYRSEVIESCWPYGNVYLGSVTPGSVAYVSGYTLKQFVLGRDDAWYAERALAKEYCRWSRRPGLGSSWYDRNAGDLFRTSTDLLGERSTNVKVRFGTSFVVAPRYYFERCYCNQREKYDIMLASKVEESSTSTTRDLSQSEVLRELDRMAALKNRLELQKVLVAAKGRI